MRRESLAYRLTSKSTRMTDDTVRKWSNISLWFSKSANLHHAILLHYSFAHVWSYIVLWSYIYMVIYMVLYICSYYKVLYIYMVLYIWSYIWSYIILILWNVEKFTSIWNIYSCFNPKSVVDCFVCQDLLFTVWKVDCLWEGTTLVISNRRSLHRLGPNPNVSSLVGVHWLRATNPGWRQHDKIINDWPVISLPSISVVDSL